MAEKSLPSAPFLSSPELPSAPFLEAPQESEDDSRQFYDDTLVGELGEGVVSGVTKLVEGVAGLAAIPVDIALDTDYGDKVSQAGETVRDALGLDPEGFVGKGAEIVSQFVYAPVKAASIAGRVYQAVRKPRASAQGSERLLVPWEKHRRGRAFPKPSTPS